MRTSVFMGLALAAVVGVAPRAQAAAYDFSAGSWIIPMDTCNQPSQSFNGTTFSGTNTASTIHGTPGNCPEGALPGRDGLLKAYGLVYRLLQHNVPVYYILDGTKNQIDSPDLTVTSTSGTPVSVVTHSGAIATYGNTTEFMNAT